MPIPKPKRTEGKIHATYTMWQTDLTENRTEDYRISLNQPRCLSSQTEDKLNRTEQSLKAVDLGKNADHTTTRTYTYFKVNLVQGEPIT